MTRLHLGESAKVNGGTQQAEAIVASAKGAILGTIQLQWSVEDPAAVERRAAERAAAARGARGADARGKPSRGG